MGLLPPPPSSQALGFEEEMEVNALLDASGARDLVFARGAFSALSTSPREVDPPEWLSLLIGDDVPDRKSLERLLALLMRDCHHVARRLHAGEAPIPTSDDADVIRQFCRGYVHIAQKDATWTGSQVAFEMTLPLMFLSGYVEPESLRTLAPEAKERPDEYRLACQERLGQSVLSLYEHFRDKRQEAERDRAAAAAERVGRNDPCPCGSGRKFKKCCGL